MSFSIRSEARRSGSRSGPPVWFGPLFAAMGAAFMVFAVLGYQNSAALSERGATTTATITDKRIQRDEDSTRYLLSYRFEAADGSTHGGSFTVSRSRFESTATGGLLTVTYLPDDPGISTADPAERPSLLLLSVVLGMTGLFVVVGIGLTVGTIRARRRAAAGPPDDGAEATPEPGSPQAPGARLTGEPDDVTRSFGRSPGRAVAELVAPPIVAVLLLAVTWLIVTGRIVADEPGDGIAFAIVCGLLGVAMVLATVGGLRRGLRTTLVRVGPDGICTPEAGLLGWADIGEVRLESSHSTVRRSGFRSTTLRPGIRRLGVVPADPGRVRPSTAATIGRLLTEVSRRAARRPLVEIDPAPIGVYEYEIVGGLGPLIAAIRAHAPVSDRTIQALMREATAEGDRVPALAPEASEAPSAQAAPADLRALDAALAPGATRPVPAAATTSLGAAATGEAVRPSLFGRPGLVPEARHSEPVRGSFRPPSGLLSGRPLGVLSDLIDAARNAFFAVLILVAAIRILAGLAGGLPPYFAFVFVVALLPFAAWAVDTLLTLPSRLGGVFAEDDTTLAVDAAGIWLPGMNRLAWDQVASIAVRPIAGTSDSDDNGVVHDHAAARWRLTVVPKDLRRLDGRPRSLQARDRYRAALGRVVPLLRSWAEPPGFSVDSDRLDAPIEDVVALIELHHPVDAGE